MALIFDYNCCSFVDHCRFISNVYKTVVCEKDTQSFRLSHNLFHILSTVDKGSNRKRKCKEDTEEDSLLEERLCVKLMYDTFLREFSLHSKSLLETDNKKSTENVRDLSRSYFESTLFDHSGINGGNNSEHSIRCKIKDEYFLVPPKSRFYCGCVKEQCKKIDGKFDLLIADPPWWNKFIRRLKQANEKLSYKMMYNEDIASIPVKDLLSENSLVAVWCTNSPANISAVKNLIFPSWGIEYVATWYWMKVTVDLQPLCAFSNGCKKQPYERLILGKVGVLKKSLETKMFVSVPSALHSHKPPLLDLLAPYVKAEDFQTLELFARYLLPNTTSVGYEPLKWQHISLYEKVS